MTAPTLVKAHGLDIHVTSTGVEFSPHVLSDALGIASHRHIRLDDIQDITMTRTATALCPGTVQIQCHDDVVSIDFCPTQQEQQATLLALVQAAKNGTLETTPKIPGFHFVALDVETANEDWGSICQVGIVTYRDGVEIDSQCWLCKPPPALAHFAAQNIAIHNIHPEDIADAPEFHEVAAAFLPLLQHQVVVAHNAQFDMTALRRAATQLDLDLGNITFGCTLALARNAKLPIARNRLSNVAEHLGVRLDQHHDALADARACGEILIALAMKDSHNGSVEEYFKAQGFSLGHLSNEQLWPLLKETNKLTVPTKSQPAPKPRWAKAATPDTIPEPNPDADPKNPFFGQHVTLTGDFAPYDKETIWQALADRGATIGKNVTKKTTLLAIGNWDSVTSKQRRAQELIDAGQSISLWDFPSLCQALGLEVVDQPPF